MALIDNLISHWRLEEASGTRVDSHGSNDLTDNNTVTQQTGKQGNCGQFTDANNEFLSRADNASLSTGDIDFLIAVWVRADAFPGVGVIASKGGLAVNSVDDEWVLWSLGDTLKFTVISGPVSSFTTVTWASTPATATWYFVVAWHDAGANTINIQVNNGTIDSLSHSGGAQSGAAPFLMGVDNATVGNWDGRIDEFSFWKRILTTDEKTQLYNSDNGIAWPWPSSGNPWYAYAQQ